MRMKILLNRKRETYKLALARHIIHVNRTDLQPSLLPTEDLTVSLLVGHTKNEVSCSTSQPPKNVGDLFPRCAQHTLPGLVTPEGEVQSLGRERLIRVPL